MFSVSDNLSVEFATLVELLRERSTRQADQSAYTFLLDGDSAVAELTYAQLDQQARAIGARLQQLGATGERVLLVYPPGLPYIAAFFGCLYAGSVAVPVYPPRRNRATPRLEAIVNDAQAKVVLTTSDTYAEAEGICVHAPYLAPLTWLATDTLDLALAAGWSDPQVEHDARAFLQYTSGSTSTPKGVMLTHGNLLHNLELIQRYFEHSTRSQGVIWLPPYHDMGLIGGVLEPLYAGFPVTLMSPMSFLQRPFNWLQAISRYRATTSGGPNFAYELCINKITPEQRATLDLSSWRVAFNGAEPVRAETLERFAATFAECGFRREAFFPCYGLAEATLIVSGGLTTQPPAVLHVDGSALEQHQVIPVASTDPDARALVQCGRPLLDQQIVIADPHSLTRTTDGQVGEIWVTGASVAQGYWNRVEETERTFQAHLDSGEGPFLRTGDLGFIHDGELFVNGRLKDLIIIRGRNFYPQDIELTVERSHPALRLGGGAAFSVDIDGEERLVVAQEISRQQRNVDVETVAGAIREAVTKQHELQVYAVVLLKDGSIPKTSSGKIQRHACRAGFLANTLSEAGRSVLGQRSAPIAAAQTAPQEESFIRKALLAVSDAEARKALLRIYVQEQIGRVLRVPPSQIGVQQSLDTLGLDSLSAVELKNEFETNLGVILPITSFMEDASIDSLSAAVVDQLAVSSAPLMTLHTDGASLSEYPLSQGQQSLWFIHQLAPESAAYNVARAIRIRGQLDLGALKQAFQSLVDRHAALRTTFARSAANDGQPVQQIHAQMAVAFTYEDAIGWSEAELGQRLVAESQRPFDLQHGPLLRVAVFQRSAQEHVLVITVHHIVIDFWSLVVLIAELRVLYPAAKTNSPAALTPLELHYVDYVRWQNELLAGPQGDQLWSYWRQQLGPEGTPSLPTLDLPTDYTRPALQTYEGRAHSFTVDAALTQQLSALAKTSGTTLYTVLLTAFQSLLHRYTGQSTIVVGSPTAGRTRAKLSDLVGYFVNPVPLKADFAQTPTFAALLEQMRQTVLGALEHQEYPFATLVERLNPARDASRSPLFQVMFILEKPHRLAEQGVAALVLGETGAQMPLDDLLLEAVALDQQVAQFDLTLTIVETDNRLLAALEYNSALFEPSTIARMAAQFETLLSGIVVTPASPVVDLPLLPDAEREQLLVDWNATAMPYPGDATLHGLFEAQAQRTPDATALVVGADRLSYAELDARANQLAQHLRRLGVGPDVLVGVFMERTTDLLIGLLGILKAGGAYVPLDPTYPADRLQFMLHDSQLPVLLTQQHLQAELPPHQAQVVRLDADWDVMAQESSAPVETALDGANLAYMIYTSGSTGRPKGVQIPHRAVVNFLSSMRHEPGLSARDTLLAVTTISFDIAGLELFLPLSVGARVVVVSREVAGDGSRLAVALRSNGATVMQATPATWRLLLDSGWPGDPALTAFCGGEALPRELADQLRPRVAALWNLYGPTETTIWSAVAQVSAAPLTIGHPIANTQLYLLDQRGQPTPQGVPGELYIGGDGVTRGYLHRPELTAEKFVPDPFGTVAGGRLYRTGDLARYRADGTLEFLGRLDHQVKVRGFRIELGEIESVVRQHAAVTDCVVLAREDVPGDQRLVAYVVAQDAITSAALRTFVGLHLPDYMLPSAVVQLDALPLTPNGKLDRKALPAPEGQHLSSGVEYVAPRTATEERLAAIWAEVLRVERVGVHDDFFALGGHSLLATQVIARVETAFATELPLRSLFATPTVAGLAATLDANTTPTQPSRPPLVAVDRSTPLPLSFAQQRLWFLQQFEPDSATYHLAAAVQLDGTLDQAALAHSLTLLVARHETLRTTFATVDGLPVQRIAPPAPVALPLIDLSALDATAQQAAIAEQTEATARAPFDVAVGPLLRVRLLRLGATTHRLLVTLHHLVADGWSIAVFTQDLATLYRATLEHGADAAPQALPALPVQYADYAVWQRQWLQGDALERQLGYWRTALAGPLPVLELPSDFPRPAQQTFHGAQLPLVLPAALTTALQQLSRREGVTLFQTVLAAFQVLLQRYTGLDDVLVGAPVANRTQTATEGLIGCFVNTLVLRGDLRDDPSFVALLAQAKARTLQAYAHQDVPFDKLVEELQPQRDLRHAPLCQVLLVLQNAPQATASLPGLALAVEPLDTGTAKFELTVNLEEQAGALVGWLEYNTDLFAQATMARMAAQFERLLHSIVAQPTARISTLPLLPDAERTRLLGAWNAATLPPVAATTIAALVAAQAQRTPDATALIVGTERLRYAELDARANQLAHHLQRLGVGPEVLVGVCLTRRTELLVALLGILKAGGAYVPLDPAYPAERVQFMLDDAQATVLLTEQALVAALPATAATVLCLDTLDLTRERTDAPLSRATAANVAYLIYTSGSTGRPKAVAIPHASAVGLLTWAAEAFTPRELARTLAATSICFDLSVFELFVPLSVGGAVVLAETALHLPQLAAAHEVTLVNTVPSALAELVRMGGIPAAVETVCLAGEPLPHALVHAIYATTAVQAVYNLYGPSEDTTYSTWTLVARDDARAPSIGRPLPSTQLYLLDQRGQPVPQGVPGELYLGGAGLARGYLHRPELTAEKFVPDPFGTVAGGRLYRTGDLARYRADGTVEFLGRLDHQVKVRGFRIELGEIESVVRQHAAVTDCVVLAREDVPGDQRLVAYVVAQDAITSAALRTFVGQHLPDYMLPSAVVQLDALPLTPNGKLDRKALPAPEGRQVAASIEYVAPRTATEEQLAAIWAEVLRVERVGVHDDFFALGGHSLLATQLASRLHDAFQVDLPLRSLFETPTIAGLATTLDAATTASSRPPLVAVDRSTPLPLSFAQQRLWFLQQFEPDSATYHLAAAVELDGTLDVSALRHSLTLLVTRHETLRTTFTTVDGLPVQRIAPPAPVELPLIDLSALDTTAQQAAVAEQTEATARAPFDVAVGPLLRVRLLRLGVTTHRLLVTLHHLVADGWSIAVFTHDLATLYRATLEQGADAAPQALPNLPVQYADYAVWQRQWLQGDALERQLSYWRTALAGPLPVLELPSDFPRPAQQTFHGAQLPLLLPASLTTALQQLSRREGATLFQTVLAAFQVLLQRYTGLDDVLVGAPVANRTQTATEGLIGCFVNTLVLRGDLRDDPSFVALLAQAKARTLQAYAHQDVPFDKLVEELQPQRDLRHAPLCQVLLVLQNAPQATASLPGLALAVEPLDTGTAKFELTVNLEEQAGALVGWLEYNTDLFAQATMARLAAQFERLLHSIVAEPTARISTLPLLPDAERTRLLGAWNAATLPPVAAATIPALVAAQAQRTPDATALIVGTERLRYAELDARANQLAHHLQRLGVGPEVLVGVCLTRRTELLVALLGILKAGGAYVPLDPAYPAERVQFMLDDAQATVLLTEQALVAALPATAATVLCLDTLDLSSERTDAPLSAATAANVAYLIYTSGSTGRPKAVAIPHASAVGLLTWAAEAFTSRELARTLAATSICFDLSVFELFVPLSVGGAVVLAETALHLPQLAAAHEVTLVNTVPSALAELVRMGGIPAAVQTVCLAGEPLPHALVQAIYSTTAVQAVYNLYGPSEDTTYSTWTLVARDDARAPSIGRPLPSTQLYLLDQRGQPVPQGVPGELYLGGAGLARGYLHRPGLTAEKFVPDPFGMTAGGRLYRTGDLARYRADGTVEFLGRLDHQVKVRGFRIELGEIESVVRQHAAVTDCVVLAREDVPGDQRLVAYVVATEAVTSAELRTFVGQHLPDYMLPSAVVQLDALPLTPNGKLDRKALPAPEGRQVAASIEYVAPRTATEEQLAAIWAEVLRVERVGVHDDFFALGGHSLLATQLASRLHDAFQVDLPLRSLFETPTIASLANSIDAIRWAVQDMDDTSSDDADEREELEL